MTLLIESNRFKLITAERLQSMLRTCFFVFISLFVFTGLCRASGSLPSPTGFFGMRPGTDSHLLDEQQLYDYYKTLAAASERIRLQVLGKTNEGRDLYALLISSPENLHQLTVPHKSGQEQ